VAASEALGFVRESRSEQALRDRFAFYGKGPEAESALHALARIAGPANARSFREALASQAVPYRVIAVEGLGRSHDREAVQLINALLHNEQEPSVLVATAFAFYVLGERANLERIVRALVDPALARQARAYVTELGAASAPELVPWLRHEDPAIRRAVAEVLGLSGHAASEAALQPVARADSDPAVAEAARRAILRLRALPRGVRTR
jgi:HEAT repeat protein